jgi:hypothetical protein
MKVAFRLAWSRAAERSVRALLGLVQRVPAPSVSWQRLSGPYFGNEVATLILDGRRAEATLQRSAPSDDSDDLVEVARVTLAG